MLDHETAFARPFVGSSVDALYEVLCTYERRFTEENIRRSANKLYYARYFPIIQSSGTGKTKLVLEVRHIILETQLDFQADGGFTSAGEEGHHRVVYQPARLC